MFPSYNHNISYAGNTFHVQTEVSGSSDKCVVTHVFAAGDIIATRRSRLADVADQADPSNLMVAMQKQHQDAMRALIAGSHDDSLKARGITLAPSARP